MSRDLKQYNNQLKYAKKLCERRIKGFNNVISDNDILINHEIKQYIEKKVFNF